ncbi:MAG: ubiquinone/menaquinone biosynthesis methyltransferase [Desulfohalobiaceae bacterium]|nr:ubiquinone/menaquinone biosynthesis methyltransferase [Desulfohalobiaceae bacterium]
MAQTPKPHSQSPDPNKQVADMFGRITPCYDILNRLLSLGMDVYWRKKLVRSILLPPGGRLLDLAAGTLDVTQAVIRAHPTAQVISVDLSRPMLKKGRTKIDDPRRAQAVCANALSLPLADASIDCVTIAFGIRNIIPRRGAYAEIYRVLAPGGKMCILEFGTMRNGILGRFYTRYLHSVLPRIGALVSKEGNAYTYLAGTISAFPRAEALGKEIAEAGFADVDYIPLSAGIVWLHTARKTS